MAGGAGGTADGGAAGVAGDGGASGAAGGGSAGAAPTCTTSVDCGEADVSFPGNTAEPSPTPTECVGQCGLVTAYSGAYKTPKTPRSCTEICAASTYEGQPMQCSVSCSKKTVNGFGDQGLVYDDGTGSPGSLAGLVTYQFSPISGAYKFQEVSCSEVPKSKLIQGSNSYTYVSHHCCCVAP